MSIEIKKFGKTSNNEDVSLYKMTNSLGTVVRIIDYGAIVQSIVLANGLDIVLGLDDISAYEKDPNYYGCVIGRNSNRIYNGTIDINGTEYSLEKNDVGTNNLHSGKNGFHKRLWTLNEEKSDFDNNVLALTIFTLHLFDGFPGNIKVNVVYTLNDNNELIIDYSGISDIDTIFNPTNHTYFNLNGHNHGSVLNNHSLMINADHYTPKNTYNVPSGEILSLADKYELRTLTPLVDDFDDNFVLSLEDGNYPSKDIGSIRLKQAATLVGNSSGVVMKLATSLPGLQFYTGGGISPSIGKALSQYGPSSGLCMETQFFPDALNHENFPSPLIPANKLYCSKTIYSFFS